MSLLANHPKTIQNHQCTIGLSKENDSNDPLGQKIAGVWPLFFAPPDLVKAPEETTSTIL